MDMSHIVRLGETLELSVFILVYLIFAVSPPSFTRFFENNISPMRPLNFLPYPLTVF